MAWPDNIQQALRLPQGARFYRCALQVNPPHYARTFRGASRADESATSETDDLALTVGCHSPSGYDIVVMTRKKTGPTWP